MAKKLVALALFVTIFALPRLEAEAQRINLRYPIVLAHGMMGFDKMAGVGGYWNKIPKTLRAHGVPVHVTRVSKLDSTEVRGEQLAKQIREIIAKSGATRVNLIGHSHGGLDARYVAGTYKDLVASVTTVGTPHQGALLADKLVEGGPICSYCTVMLRAFGHLLAFLSDDPHEQHVHASLASLTTQNAKVFNARFPLGLPETYCGEGRAEDQGIRFYSWSGTQVQTNAFDFTDYLFTITALADDRETDGLVERCSSHFGRVIRDDYKHNHLDLINGMWGRVGNDKHPIDIFVEHAQRLAADGL